MSVAAMVRGAYVQARRKSTVKRVKESFAIAEVCYFCGERIFILVCDGFNGEDEYGYIGVLVECYMSFWCFDAISR